MVTRVYFSGYEEPEREADYSQQSGVKINTSATENPLFLFTFIVCT